MSGASEYWDRVGPETDWLHRQLRRLGVREADLDDVTQEVLVAVHRRWDDFDRTRAIRSWLFGFAFRMASDYRKRSANRHPTLPLVHEPRDPAPAADERMEAADRCALLLEALDHLDLDRRAILTLVDLEEQTVPEAVPVLEIPLNTGYSRLRAARAELADAVRAIEARRSS